VVSSSHKLIYAALIGNALSAVTKFVAAVVTGSSAMISEGIHSVVDTGNQLLLLYGIRQSKKSAAILGLVVVFVGISLGHLTGWLYFDGIASAMIGIILAGIVIWLAIETKSLLIGESATPDVVRGIRQTAKSCREIRHVNEILTMHMGPDYVLVNLSVEFDDDVSAADICRLDLYVLRRSERRCGSLYHSAR